MKIKDLHQVLQPVDAACAFPPCMLPGAGSPAPTTHQPRPSNNCLSVLAAAAMGDAGEEGKAFKGSAQSGCNRIMSMQLIGSAIWQQIGTSPESMNMHGGAACC